jgi:hypothetical protein
MSFLRWAPTLFAYPLGGFLAVLSVGSVTDPLTAAVAALIAGTVIGAAQWLALGRAAGWRWLVGIALGMTAGSTISAAITGASTDLLSLAVSGLITGALVGVMQGFALRRGARTIAVWTAVLSASWAIGLVVTANVIVDIERGYVVFGSSGALVVTIITGIVLRRILGRRRAKRRAAEQPAAAATVVPTKLASPR